MKLAKSLSVFIPIVLAVFTLSAYAEGTRAQVLSLSGIVQIKDAEGEWKQVSKGDILFPGAELSTKEGELQIGFLETQKSAVDVKPNSTVVLESLDPVRIDIRDGRIFSLIKDLRPGSDFVVKTPTAVASARGTGGEHSMDSLIVHDGTFSVLAGDEERPISEGTGVTFDGSGFGETVSVSEESLAEWNGFVSDAVTHLSEASNTQESKSEEKPEEKKEDSQAESTNPPDPPSDDNKDVETVAEKGDVSDKMDESFSDSENSTLDEPSTESDDFGRESVSGDTQEKGDYGEGFENDSFENRDPIETFGERMTEKENIIEDIKQDSTQDASTDSSLEKKDLNIITHGG